MDQQQYVVCIDPTDNKPIEIQLSICGTLSLEQLQNTFPGACGLKFENPATQRMRSVEQCNYESEKIFVAPQDGWNGKQFVVMFPPTTPPIMQSSAETQTQDAQKEAKRLRPASGLAFEGARIAFDDFVRSARKKLDDSINGWMYFIPRSLDENKVVGDCAFVIASDLVITHGHGPNRDKKRGDRMTIRSVFDLNEQYELKVAHNDPGDFLILKADKDIWMGPLKKFAPRLTNPHSGEKYVSAGLSVSDARGGKIPTYRSGFICTTEPDDRGRILGGADADFGDSGGGCFVLYGDTLQMIGIVSASVGPKLEDIKELNAATLVEGINFAILCPNTTKIVPAWKINEAIQHLRIQEGCTSIQDTTIQSFRSVPCEEGNFDAPNEGHVQVREAAPALMRAGNE